MVGEPAGRDGWAASLAAFAAGPALVQRAWESAPEALRAVPGPEGWSANDVAVHLSDAELVRAFRIRIMCAGAARLDPFDEDAWRVSLRYAAADTALALDAYEATVAATADLLRRMGAEAAARAASHPELGDVTVATLVERGIEHAAAHAAQIRALTAPPA